MAKATKQRGGGASSRVRFNPEGFTESEMDGVTRFRGTSRDWVSAWVERRLAVSGVIGGVKVA